MKSQLLATTGILTLIAASSCSGEQRSGTAESGGAMFAAGGNVADARGGAAGTAGTSNGAGGALSGGVSGTAGNGGGAGKGLEEGASVNGGTGNLAGAAGGGVRAAGGDTLGSGGGAGAARGGSAGLAGAQASGGKASSGGSSGGLGGAGGARPTVTAASGTTLVKVNSAVRHQTFEGWGTSLCWWASHVGGWRAAARDAVVDAVINPESGLGYNIFRYNIGGGENPAHDHMGTDREMPGFEPSAGKWTWDADANQRAILQSIAQRASGVIFEAFSNSPPYWMTKSGCASGSSDGTNNLKDDSYDAFADYLTEVVKHYKDEFGITFRTLEPLNEPSANWWKSNGSQEGCHFSASNQETIIKAVAAKLSSKGLDTVVSASDENSMDDAYNNLRAFSTATLAAIGQMNAHSYAGTKRAELRTLATSKGKRLWQSESGPLNQTLADDTEAALFMAGRIITDLRDLQAEAWIDWQVGDPSRNWASFTLNDSQQTAAPLKRFYMHAGFSRYIRPGAVFVDVNDANMLAAVSADGRTLTLVVRNGDTAASKGFTFDLTALPVVGTAAEAHRTSRSENLVSLTSVAIQNYSFVAMVPAFSITTFVIPLGP